MASLQLLQIVLQTSIEERQKKNDEKLENDCQSMEILHVAKRTHTELTNILKKHEGHASRVIGNALNLFGVDENVYHKRSIDGNHCIKLAENGDAIVSKITTEMKKIIKHEAHVEYLTKLDTSLKEILRTWYDIMRVMKSVERQSQQAISKFKNDWQSLKRSINKFVQEQPVPGANIKHPSFLKSHILFDKHIQEFLEIWETLGAFDEQGIEGIHPQWNQLLTQFGTTRGITLKKQMMKQHLFRNASWVVDMIDELIESTSKKGRENTKARAPSADIEVQDVETDQSDTIELTELEKKCNENQILHPAMIEGHPFLVDTAIVVCDCCSAKRLLKFAEGVHKHEYHSITIANEVDDGVMEQLQLAAAL
jgi:hypothetical protein